MVNDGVAQMNGSDAAAVAQVPERAGSHVKIPVRISSADLADAKTIRVHLAVDALPADFKARKADIFVALALAHAESHVSAGATKRRDMRHVAVAESICKVGTVDKGKNFDLYLLLKHNATV